MLLNATSHVILSGLRLFLPNAEAGHYGIRLIRRNLEPKRGIRYNGVERDDSKKHYSIRGTIEYPVAELLLTD